MFQLQSICMTLCICNVQNRQMHRGRKCISDCQGPVSGDMGWLTMDMGFCFQVDENFLKLFCDDGCTTLNIPKKKKKPTELNTISEVILWYVHYILTKLFFLKKRTSACLSSKSTYLPQSVSIYSVSFLLKWMNFIYSYLRWTPSTCMLNSTQHLYLAALPLIDNVLPIWFRQ